MVKTLLNKIGRGAKYLGLVAIAGLSIGLAGCKMPGPNPNPDPPTPPVDPSVPTVNLSGVAGTTLTEGQKGYITNLPQTDDKGNPVTYNSSTCTSSNLAVVNLDSNSQLDATSSSISQDQNYQVKLGFTDNVTGKQGTSDLEGKIQNLSDFVGMVKSDEPGVQQAGAVNAYDANDLTTLIGQTTFDANGNLKPFQLNKRVSQVVLRAKFTSNGFVREIILDGTKDYDLTDKLVVVPYEPGWTEIDADNFIADMGRKNFSDIDPLGKPMINPAPQPGSNYLKKWNLGELTETILDTKGHDINHPIFRGAEVSSHDFLPAEYDQIKKFILTSLYPNANSLNVVYGDSHDGENGWGRIVLGDNGDSNPNNDAPGTIVLDSNQDGYIERFTTYLTHLQILDYIVRDEVLGHGLNFPGHADSPSITALFDSIVKYANLNPPNDFTPNDIKESYIIKEPSFQGKESEKKILGKIL
jgi:hypothetical protein